MWYLSQEKLTRIHFECYSSPSKHLATMLRATLCFVGAVVAVSAQYCSRPRATSEYACAYPELLLVSSPNSQVVHRVNCNSEFNKLEWEETPRIMFPGAKLDKSYTLVVIDPDAPEYASDEAYLHWVATNITGEELRMGTTCSSREMMEYYGPEPPEGSGKHRYMFLLFEQQNKWQYVSEPERENFKLLPWLRNQWYDLCGPVAGTQFISEF